MRHRGVAGDVARSRRAFARRRSASTARRRAGRCRPCARCASAHRCSGLRCAVAARRRTRGHRRAGAGSGRAARAGRCSQSLASARRRRGDRSLAAVGGEQGLDGGGERVGAAARHGDRRAAVGELAQAFGIANDRGRAARHRLEHRQAEGLLVAGVDEGVGARQHAGELARRGDEGPDDDALALPRRRRPRADDKQHIGRAEAVAPRRRGRRGASPARSGRRRRAGARRPERPWRAAPARVARLGAKDRGVDAERLAGDARDAPVGEVRGHARGSARGRGRSRRRRAAHSAAASRAAAPPSAATGGQARQRGDVRMTVGDRRDAERAAPRRARPRRRGTDRRPRSGRARGRRGRGRSPRGATAADSRRCPAGASRAASPVASSLPATRRHGDRVAPARLRARASRAWSAGSGARRRRSDSRTSSCRRGGAVRSSRRLWTRRQLTGRRDAGA